MVVLHLSKIEYTVHVFQDVFIQIKTTLFIYEDIFTQYLQTSRRTCVDNLLT